MTDQEILKKYNTSIKVDINALLKEENITNIEDIKRVTKMYKEKFVIGFRKGVYKETIKKAKLMLSNGELVEEIMKYTNLSRSEIEGLK